MKQSDVDQSFSDGFLSIAYMFGEAYYPIEIFTFDKIGGHWQWRRGYGTIELN